MKSVFSLMVILITIVVAGCDGSKTSGDAVQLKLNLVKGKTYTCGTNTHLDMKVQSMATGLDMAYTYKIIADVVDSAGNQVVNSTIDGLKFKAEVMGMSMGYDSKEVIDTNHQDAMSGMVRKIFSGMLGRTFKVTINPNGNIEKVTGVEEIVNAMIEQIPGSDEDKEKMKQKLQQSFNPMQVKQTFAQLFNIYPNKPVKVGDSWNKDMDMGLGGMKSKQQITFTVKDITSSSIILNLKGDLKTLVASHQDSTNITPETHISGSETGIMTIDKISGLATSGDIDLNFKGSMDMKGSSTPMDIKGKITITNK